MPYRLDEIDIALLKSLFKDGRKSFRQISRENRMSAPTVKARYQRLVNLGLVKGVFPTLEFGKLESKARVQLGHLRLQSIKGRNVRFDNDILVKLSCDYCRGPIPGRPMILKFANFERFFCCKSCRSLYKEKHKTRIASIYSQHKNMNS